MIDDYDEEYDEEEEDSEPILMQGKTCTVCGTFCLGLADGKKETICSQCSAKARQSKK